MCTCATAEQIEYKEELSLRWVAKWLYPTVGKQSSLDNVLFMIFAWFWPSENCV